MAGGGKTIGLYGFGAVAHILAQVCRWKQQEVYAFVRPGDDEGKRFALEMGAVWAGSPDQVPPKPLDAAILFAPAGELVPKALAAVRKGDTVVCGGIHMSEIPAMPYRLLWGSGEWYRWPILPALTPTSSSRSCEQRTFELSQPLIPLIWPTLRWRIYEQVDSTGRLS
jgi:hypothetical protein